MNIFYLSPDPEIAARVQYNKHIVKIFQKGRSIKKSVDNSRSDARPNSAGRSAFIALLSGMLLLGCNMPSGTWQITVAPDGYYQIWAGGEVVKKVGGPATFTTTGPPQGSPDFPALRSGLPGQSPAEGRGYGFMHTDGRSIVVCPFFCSSCEKIE